MMGLVEIQGSVPLVVSFVEPCMRLSLQFSVIKIIISISDQM